MTEWALPAERLVEFETARQAQTARSRLAGVAPLYSRRHMAQFPREISRSQRDVHADAAGQPALAADHFRRRGRRAAPFHQPGPDRTLSRSVQLLVLARSVRRTLSAPPAARRLQPLDRRRHAPRVGNCAAQPAGCRSTPTTTISTPARKSASPAIGLSPFSRPAGAAIFTNSTCGACGSTCSARSIGGPRPITNSSASAAHSQHDPNAVASIHDAVRFKQPDLDRMLVYDNWPRKSLVDHFLPPEHRSSRFPQRRRRNRRFCARCLRDEAAALARARRGGVGPRRSSSVRTAFASKSRSSLEASAGNRLAHPLRIVEPAPRRAVSFRGRIQFRRPGRREPLTATSTTATAASSVSSNRFSISNRAERIGLVDEWLGIDVGIEPSFASRHLDVSHSDGEPVRRGLRAGAPIECRGAALGFPGRTRRALSRGNVADSRHVSRSGPRTVEGLGRRHVRWPFRNGGPSARRASAHPA